MQQIEKTPLVSVVMAVKDTAPYLRACLDSILAQDYQNWELIAVNDHSSDATPQILAAYAARDPRVRVFDSPRPSLIPTLQYGYAQVRGSLINRMDSDDKMPTDKLSFLVDAWQQHGPGHVIAGGTTHFVDEGTVGDGFRRYERWLNQVARESRHLDEIYKECVIPSHSWLLHKTDLDRVGAFDPEVYPEDYDLCFRFYQHGLQIIGVDKVLHYWRDRSDRISRTWEVYKDNRYFNLKLDYFYRIDRDTTRPLVLIGGGRNGKAMAKLLLECNETVHWICNNPKKIGKDIYGIRMHAMDSLESLENPQIMLVVSAADARPTLEAQLQKLHKHPRTDYWFFL